MPRHETPAELARLLREAARRLEETGLDAIDLVSALASRGYAAATLGDGGSRGSDSTSSTERHGSRYLPDHDRNGNLKSIPSDVRWVEADVDYATALRDLGRLAVRVTASTNEIMRHASDEDRTKTGSGICLLCARSCMPTKDKPGDRLRSGLCPTCYRAWNRYQNDGGTMTRGEWVAKRREDITERDAAGNIVKIHTPEPDHDIDLSTEKAPA